MLIGVFLRYIKTYSGINYIPLSNGEKFCGLVGINGIGKSSVLEALDYIFNDKVWNINLNAKKSGLSTTNPYIVPIFLLKKDKITANVELANKFSDAMWAIEETDINAPNRIHFKSFNEQRANLIRDGYQDDYLLIPIGITHEKVISLSIFNNKFIGEAIVESFDSSSTTISDDQLESLSPLYYELRDLFEYIYIPKDIDPELFTQLENREVQTLMGETLMEIIERCVPQAKIEEINKNLNEFIANLKGVLADYSFRTPTVRQQNLRRNDVYGLIIEAFFKIRKLHKQNGDSWLEVNVLSSGEKQQAIINIASYFLSNYRQHTNTLILAIDEPESSLHMSACFDQFDTLFKMSSKCCQLLFTTHWYGFIPTVDKGYLSVITKEDNDHQVDLVNIASYREEVKQAKETSKGKLPYDIRLKSLNDFVQSIITSIITDTPYNWLICEGSSEKIYFEKYFTDIKEDKKLRIIPVGGASEIKRLYNYLAVAYEDFRKEIKGKIVLVSDTDKEIVQYPTRNDTPNLICQRIVNDGDKKRTVLVKIDSNVVSPKTEIEDSLNGKLFFETLMDYHADHEEVQTLIKDFPAEISEESAYFALDVSPRKADLLEQFFDKPGIKYSFAKNYSERISLSYNTPDWITELKTLY